MNNFVRSRRKKRTVLMVDDELINRELLEAILAFNYNVDSAENGSEAMQMLRSAKEPYSLILLDLLMPKMSGFQVLEQCKADEELSKIPIIVMTSEKSAEVRSIKLGADDFITKPYRMPEVILARCERIIELSEERALIREIEKDKLTGFYKSDFFFAYIRRMETRGMDAVALHIDGLDKLKAEAGDEAVNLFLQNTAQRIRENDSTTKGIVCYAGDGRFYAYFRHRDDYKELFEKAQTTSFSEQNKGVTLRCGVYERVDKELNPEEWFERAESACADRKGANYIEKYQG